MTFIELVRAVRGRVGMQGSGPVSVTSASGAELDLVNVTSDAWLDIQNSREDWVWMRGQASFNTAVGTTLYTPLMIFGSTNNRLNRWRKDSLYFTDTDGIKKYVPSCIDYDLWTYRHINDTEDSSISEWTIRPNDDAILINSPKSIYPVQIDYQKKPQTLSVDTDTPELPSHFHLLIVYSAVVKYSTIISSPELYDKYSFDFDKLYGDLQRRYLPKKKLNVIGIA